MWKVHHKLSAGHCIMPIPPFLIRFKHISRVTLIGSGGMITEWLHLVDRLLLAFNCHHSLTSNKPMENKETHVSLEGDVLGATLFKPVVKCTVAILKHWLVCCGANTSGKKNKLVQR